MIPMTDRQFNVLADIARRDSGIDIPIAKKAFLAARLQKRLRAIQIPDIESYLDLTSRTDNEGATERENFIFSLTTNVTSLWRESHHFLLLAEELARLSAQSAHTHINIWSAGCSSGAELLSIAATCRFALGEHWASRVRILGTDIDRNILAESRDALENIALSNMRDGAPFSIATTWEWHNSLSQAITLERHNLLQSLDPNRYFDIAFCRNVTIYFDLECQTRAQETICARLTPGSLLFLGHSERLHATSLQFETIGRTAYRVLERTGGRTER